MHRSGEEQNETVRPQFDSSILIDFQGAKITSDTGFLLLQEIDERFGILGPMGTELEDTRSWVHSKHSLLQMTRQRTYQIAAGYEDCNEADFLRIDPALRLAIGKGEEVTRSMQWLIKGLIKVGARVSYHGRRWLVHVASAFPLSHHYREVFG